MRKAGDEPPQRSGRRLRSTVQPIPIRSAGLGPGACVSTGRHPRLYTKQGISFTLEAAGRTCHINLADTLLAKTERARISRQVGQGSVLEAGNFTHWLPQEIFAR
jgi:hypothetical protein